MAWTEHLPVASESSWAGWPPSGVQGLARAFQVALQSFRSKGPHAEVGPLRSDQVSLTQASVAPSVEPLTLSNILRTKGRDWVAAVTERGVGNRPRKGVVPSTPKHLPFQDMTKTTTPTAGNLGPPTLFTASPFCSYPQLPCCI